MKITIIVMALLSLLLMTGCEVRQDITIDANCMNQAEYDSAISLNPKSVELRLSIADKCSNFCEDLNATCYSYAVKGCNLLADHLIFKCLTKTNEMKIYLPD